MNDEQNVDEQVRQIEISSEFAQSLVDKGDMWSKLLENKEFKTLVIEGYFKDESERLVGLLADPEFDTEEKKTDLYSQMAGIAHFRMKIVQDQRMAHQMRGKLASNNATIADLESGE